MKPKHQRHQNLLEKSKDAPSGKNTPVNQLFRKKIDCNDGRLKFAIDIYVKEITLIFKNIDKKVSKRSVIMRTFSEISADYDFIKS